MRTFLLGFLLPAFLLGCSASADGSLFGNGGGGGASASSGGKGGGSAVSSSNNSGVGGTSFVTSTGSGSDAGPPLEAEVFAHSPNTLFRLDPLTKSITTVGPFIGASSMIDIALDEKGAMFGTTFGGLYRIDKKTANCTSIASGSYPNSLSFVPKGTVDPNVEALVGYIGSSYVRIDTTTGQITTIGALLGGYTSSGDVVSVIGGGTYLTVKGPNCSDCILEVNPTTGALVKLIGSVNHTDTFGLAFWGGVAYGFNQGGVLFQIDLTTGMTLDIPFPNAPPGLIFWGAGSTTSAPVMPPK